MSFVSGTRGEVLHIAVQKVIAISYIVISYNSHGRPNTPLRGPIYADVAPQLAARLARGFLHYPDQARNRRHQILRSS